MESSYSQAKLAVTNTLAKPLIPFTNGAPSIRQFVVPIGVCRRFTPALTKIPTIINATIVTTFSKDKRYSKSKLIAANNQFKRDL